MELLKKLTSTDSVSGSESAVRELIISEIRELCDEYHTDPMGNLIAHIKGDGARIMLAAHMDEIGVMVTHIGKNGFLRFSAVGGLNTKELPHRRVRFSNGTVGVIGSEEEAFDEKPDIKKLYIEIGASDRDQAEAHVGIGDTAAFDGETLICGSRIISKALDNRAGCYMLLRAMRELQSPKNDLYFVFTSQEEVGLRGAKAAAYAVDPKYAIAVDVTDTGDMPSAPVMDVRLGGGAAIKVMDRSIMCDADIRCAMIEAAKEKGIKYQLEIMADGGTDAGAIHLTRAGVKTGGISLPTRYVHSPAETADRGDLEECVKLLIETVKRL